MLFTDGNRIDLTLVPLKLKDKHFGSDKLTVVLLDKDSSLPPLPSPTDDDYWVRRIHRLSYLLIAVMSFGGYLHM